MVLVADPAEAARRHVARVVAALGLACREVASAEACLEQLAAEDLAAVICDPLLAGEQGLDWVRRLRRQRPDLPLVAYTADTRRQQVAALRRAGVVDVVAKPARDERLAAALERCLASGARWGRP